MIGYILLYAAWAIIPITVLILYRRRPPRLVIAGIVMSMVLVRAYWGLLVTLSIATLLATLVYTIVDIRRARRLDP